LLIEGGSGGRKKKIADSYGKKEAKKTRAKPQIKTIESANRKKKKTNRGSPTGGVPGESATGLVTIDE